MPKFEENIIFDDSFEFFSPDSSIWKRMTSLKVPKKEISATSITLESNVFIFSVTADIVFYLISCDYFHTFRFLLIVSSSFSSVAAAAVGAINVANQNIISVLLHDYVTLRFTLRTLTKFHPTDTGR